MLNDTSRRRTATMVVCLVGAVICVLLGAASGTGSAASGPRPVPIQVRLTGTSQAIPRSFFGLSMEYTGVPSYSQMGPLFDRVVAMVRPQDGSRMLLRIGGKSADHFYWEVPTTGAPPGVTELGQPWMNDLTSIVARDHMRVMLDLNLAVHSPTMAVAFAKAANAALPRGTLAGLEIGNEPDLYTLQRTLQVERIATTLKSVPNNWQHDYSPADYRRDYISYARALKAALPNVPLGGPEAISYQVPWLSAIEGLGRLDPGFLTIHRYASSNCWPTSSPFYPTIAVMLSPAASAGLAGTVRGAVTYAHVRHQALRLTEVNSISCGGNTGVADSFATALWAPDVLFQMISEGVDSVSWHIRTTSVNAPFVPSGPGIIAKPELYGLAVFAQMFGSNASLLGTKITTSGPSNLSAWPVRSSQGLKVLLINKSPRAANVRLALGTGSTKAFVRLLQAPSISSSQGVTFAGQSIGPSAQWQGTPVVSTVKGARGSFGVAVPGYSAALVTF